MDTFPDTFRPTHSIWTGANPSGFRSLTSRGLGVPHQRHALRWRMVGGDDGRHVLQAAAGGKVPRGGNSSQQILGVDGRYRVLDSVHQAMTDDDPYPQISSVPLIRISHLAPTPPGLSCGSGRAQPSGAGFFRRRTDYPIPVPAGPLHSPRPFPPASFVPPADPVLPGRFIPEKSNIWRDCCDGMYDWYVNCGVGPC